MLRFLVVAACLALSNGAYAQGQNYQLTLAGASPGGLWSSLGLGLDKVMKAAYPGSTVTYQTSGGGFANIQLLEKNSVQLGIVHNMELRMAQNGQPPFKSKIGDLRVIAYLYNWAPVQLLVNKDFAEKYGIKTFEDLATKKPPIRVATNRRGNVVNELVDRMFKAINVSDKDVASWGGSVVPAASQEQDDLMRNRRLDATFNSLFVRQRSILEMANSVNLVMLPVGDETIAKVAQNAGVDRYVIPAKSYEFQPEDVPTVSLGALLVVNKSMSDQDAYNIAKALVEHVDEMRGVHPAMKALSAKFLTEQKAGEFHPGALKLFKEKGLL